MIAAQSRVLRAVQALSLCSDALVEARTEAELLRSVCQILVESAGYRLAWVGWALEDEARTVQPVAHAGFDDGYLERAAVSWGEDDPRGQGPTGTAIRTGEPVVARNILTDARFQPWREDALSRGYGSSIALPLQLEGRVVGALSVYAPEAEAFDAQEIALLERMAANLTVGVFGLRARAEAEAKSALLRAVWEASPDMIVVHDAAGALVDVNRAACEGFGATREEMLHSDLRRFMPEDIAPEALAHLGRVLSTGEPADMEWIARRTDGTTFPVEVNLRGLFFGGEPRVLALIRDLTEQHRAERERRNVERLNALAVLAGGLAHDFNNLLAGVLGNVELARTLLEPSVGEPVPQTLAAVRALSQAEEATLRAAGLTRQLATFAKNEPVSGQTVRVADVVAQTAQFSLRGTPVKLTLDLPDDLWPLRADEGQVGQVVQNLSLNAAQALGERGGTFRIEGQNIVLASGNPVGLPAGDYVRLRFCDDGPGISRDLVARIFDPWFTTKERGSGLGLAICFSILRRHGGHLSLLDVLDGACFQAVFPRSEDVEESVPPDAVPAPPRALRVLVMDDEPLFRSLAARILALAGNEVVTVCDGDEAVHRYREAHDSGAPFDVVVLDLVVPGGTGGQAALARIRAVDPRVRAIASSGLSKKEAHGFDAVLRKPYRMADLLAEISRIVED